MQTSEYSNIFKNEDRHFFYTTNHKIVLSLLDKYLPKKKKLKILDAGCGTGLLTKKLEKYGTAIGLDYSNEALKYAKKRKIKTKQGSIVKIPYKDNFFDLLVSIDVLYHKAVKSDSKAINEFYRVLKPGGILLVRVPANKWLRLLHDYHVHTRNRYTREELSKKLLKNNFIIEKLSYINMLLLPLAFFKMLMEFILKPNTSSGISSMSNVINRTISFVLSMELFFLKQANLPFGLGLIAVCKKHSH